MVTSKTIVFTYSSDNSIILSVQYETNKRNVLYDNNLVNSYIFATDGKPKENIIEISFQSVKTK